MTETKQELVGAILFKVFTKCQKSSKGDSTTFSLVLHVGI